MYSIFMPWKRLIDDMAENAGGSDSEDQSVAQNDTPSESHVLFFTKQSEEYCVVTTPNRCSPQPPSGRHRCAHQDSKMRFLLSSLLEVDFKAAFEMRKKFKADDA